MEEIDKAAGDAMREVLKPGASQVGIAFGEMAKWVLHRPTNTLKRWNLENDLIQQRNEEKIRQKFSQIPEENVVPVPPEIATPILDNLDHTSNETIADMFVNLLANAANQTTAHKVHPRYRIIVESLSVDEALIIQSLKGKKSIPYLSLRAILPPTKVDGKTRRVDKIIRRYLSPLFDLPLQLPDNMETYVENLISLGVLMDEKEYYLNSDEEYIYLQKRFSRYMLDYQAQTTHRYPPKTTFDLKKSYLDITTLGKKFVAACTESPTSATGS